MASLHKQSFCQEISLCCCPLIVNATMVSSMPDLTKTTIKGDDSFFSIAESLQGLTTCIAIREKNPEMSPWGLDDKVRLLVPLRCACPSLTAVASKASNLLGDPIEEGKKQQNLSKDEDLEQQQLSLSVRTASEKKVSFAGSQNTGDCQIVDSVTPRKVLLELYTIEELRKATVVSPPKFSYHLNSIS
ncbi:hypothetical protein V6N13_128201 [Hibiscus sabdariffa]|uniref:LYK3/4/5 second LysM domain-containing protein n=2 Tax=Hibiscus sabdariffa TaxID=183260 RepID=A0ABR2P1P8_9ROSI